VSNLDENELSQEIKSEKSLRSLDNQKHNSFKKEFKSYDDVEIPEA
jgi:hypothetical protein